jgi:hypothetical protein
MSWASVGDSKLSRAIAVKSSSLRDIGRSPSCVEATLLGLFYSPPGILSSHQRVKPPNFP